MKDLKINGLTKKESSFVPRSFDVVGDILIFSDFPSELENKQKIIGDYFLQQHKNIKVILKKTKKYSGKFRTAQMRVVSGERRKETIYVEDIAKNLSIGYERGCTTVWLINDEHFGKMDADKDFISHKIENLSLFLKELRLLKSN